MPRIRSIKPELFDDPDVGMLSAGARWLFVGLLTQADRRGRLIDDARRLKVRICAFDDGDVSAYLEELACARLIIRYEADDVKCIQIRTFEKHQRPHRKEIESTIPEIPSAATTVKVRLRRVKVDTSREKDSTSPPVSGDLVSGDLVSGDLVSGDLVSGEGNGGERVPRQPALTPTAVVDAWNQIVTPPISKVERLTDDRRDRIATRIRTFPEIDDWRRAFAWVNVQPWCRAPGTGDHPNWTASLDWLTKNDRTLARYVELSKTTSPPLITGVSDKTRRNLEQAAIVMRAAGQSS